MMTRKMIKFCLFAFVCGLPLFGSHTAVVYKRLSHDNPAIALYEYLVYYNVPFPHMWLRVSKLEAGYHLNSTLASKHNNFFGFNRPRMRKTTALAHHCTPTPFFACYANMEMCVIDLKMWCDMSPIGPNERFGDYLIRRGWHPNANAYVRVLENINIAEINHH